MKATENYLLKVLSNNDVTFFIPPYQRNYEWDKSQCEVFFEDIKKTTIANQKGEESEHFFGTIVYVQNEAVFGQPNKLVLTDGQQRITTTMLFLVAIRDVIEDERSKEYIDSKYLKNDSVADETEYKIKLKQVETDWEAYRSIVLGLELLPETKASAIYENYNYFIEQLKELKESNTIPIEDLISKGIDKFSIVTIQLEPVKNHWENPQEIFESMNSLGKPLSLADLVRNYLLLGKNAEEQNRLYKNYWLTIEKQLPDQVSNFIRDYMQLQAKKDFKKATTSNYKELYSNFKNQFKKIATTDLLADLNKYSKYYSYIVLGRSSGNNMIDRRLSDLRTINVTILYSFLLSILEKWDVGDLTDDETVAVLDALIVYFLRRRILKLTQGENKNFPQLVRKVNRLVEAEDKKKKMFEILANQEHAIRLPNDIEVAAELKGMNFYNFSQAKFILALIEEAITKSRPDKNDKNLQMEHIMPQMLNQAWQEELGEGYEVTHQEFINNLGNLSLIRHNQELGNKPFGIKKDIYEKNAGLQIAKDEIINRSKWNKNSIQNRNKWLTNLILDKVLLIPDEMRNKNNFSQKGRNKRLSFTDLELIGETINYISDKSIELIVVNDREVEFEGKQWKLSPLTREIETRKGTVNPSGAYQGAQYWEYDGIKLSDIM